MVKTIGITSAVALTLLMIISAPARAHHSVAAEFELGKEITIVGTLTKLELVNPHVWLSVDVRKADGSVTSWRLESLSPNVLIRQGLKLKTDVKIGGTYSFRINPGKKDPTLGFMKAITVNGKEWVVIEVL